MLFASLVAGLLAPSASARHSTKPGATPAAPGHEATARAETSCEPLPGDTPDELPVLRSAVALNYSKAMLDSPTDDSVVVCVLVDSTGTVREAGLSRPATPFDEAALEAARWWVFAPARSHGRPVPARMRVTVAAHVPRDADPLVPDVVSLARDAELRGDLRGALDAWTGALARVGTHPALQNEWAIRERVVSVAARLPKPPEVPMMTVARARSTHNLMLRNVARGPNEDYARALDDVLLVAPWYADGYRWRASARAASGQRDGAARDVLCYRLAVHDSVGRALAERALVALASADTLAALTMLKN
jgi:TonB family protein